MLTSPDYDDIQGERSETWSPKIAVASPSFGREVTADSIRILEDKSSHINLISCLETLPIIQLLKRGVCVTYVA